jgi:protein-tyrosine phosphatase
MACALAHQNERWAAVTPDRIRTAAGHLAGRLRQEGLPLTVFPGAEVMAHTELEAAWRAGDLLSVADRGQFLLVEMPHGLCVDLRPTVQALRTAGVRVLLAHPERHPELLEDSAVLEELVRAGCLVQVSTGSITDPDSRQAGRALRGWFRRGLVHVLGSDGHSPRSRPPRMADAYRQVARWVGTLAADRVASTNGIALLQGLPLKVAAPLPRARSWFGRLW